MLLTPLQGPVPGRETRVWLDGALRVDIGLSCNGGKGTALLVMDVESKVGLSGAIVATVKLVAGLVKNAVGAIGVLNDARGVVEAERALAKTRIVNQGLADASIKQRQGVAARGRVERAESETAVVFLWSMEGIILRECCQGHRMGY
ncbi:hypothetical protein CTA2_9130 [Colletotrichum tanaceti]|nr:hypothetical protein CTA2_9130 [Colletotrichum tanaceti]